MKYGELNLGQVEAIVNKLGGMEGVRRFLSGQLVVKELEHKWKVWKTIKLGTGLKTADDFIQAFRSNGFRIDYYAEGMLKERVFTESIATQETEIELVNVSVAELGLKEGVTTQEVYKQARKNKLELCPAEVGPQLRLQYKNQPNKNQPIDEYILIGMKPIQGVDRIFRVYDCYKKSIDVAVYVYGQLDSIGAFLHWAKCTRWVFVRRKSC